MLGTGVVNGGGAECVAAQKIGNDPVLVRPSPGVGFRALESRAGEARVLGFACLQRRWSRLRSGPNGERAIL